tara:strand:+ start:853 stop:2088 length:1236 start_codon:yes stop_codon:yes gene_type:complete
MKLDDWQKKVLETDGNIVLRSGRQVGKSTIIGVKAGKYALDNPKKNILVIASVERQAYLLFDKILEYIYETDKRSIKKGKDRPTKSRIKLTNGSTIYCLPTGLSGHGIRGYTIDLLIADEAAFIPEEVWTAVTPMLAVTRGDIILLSTPFGKGGYFFRCFSDKTFTSFNISSEDCPRKNQDFLDQEKSRMSKLQYAQEYLGEFVDELRQFFATKLIKSCMTLRKDTPIASGTNYLGVDVARMGRDDSVLFSIMEKNGNLTEIDLMITSKTLTTETVRAILEKDIRYNYKKIFVDDQGLGVAVFDPLLEHTQTRRKVIPINNSSRGLDLDKESGKRKKLLKEDLYNNLLSLMEQGRVRLRDNPDVMLSLKSVQAEYTDDGRLKLFGNYTHITEALIRAAWCIREKSLNIYIY